MKMPKLFFWKEKLIWGGWIKPVIFNMAQCLFSKPHFWALLPILVLRDRGSPPKFPHCQDAQKAPLCPLQVGGCAQAAGPAEAAREGLIRGNQEKGREGGLGGTLRSPLVGARRCSSRSSCASRWACWEARRCCCWTSRPRAWTPRGSSRCGEEPDPVRASVDALQEICGLFYYCKDCPLYCFFSIEFLMYGIWILSMIHILITSIS